MRKFGIIVVLSLLVSVGCDRPAPIEGPREISFSSQYNRSLIENVEDLQKENVKVFGSYTLDGNTAVQFNGTRLYYDAELPGWGYDDKQFWISKAVYNFYAIAPYSAAECTFSAEDGTVTINDYESGSGLNDLLYAATTRDLTDYDDFSTVPLQFHHACTAVQFNLVNASSQVLKDVRNIRLVGLKNRGDFSFDSTGAAAWSLDGSTVGADDAEQPFGGICTLPSGGLPVNLNVKYPLYNERVLILIPQTVYKTPVTLHLEYIKEGDAEYAVRNIELGWLGGATPTEWKAGEKYEYNLTITDNTITAEVILVDWVDNYVDL